METLNTNGLTVIAHIKPTQIGKFVKIAFSTEAIIKIYEKLI